MKPIILLLFFGAIIAVILRWRARSRERVRFIDGYSFEKLLDRRLAARRPELTQAQRVLVFEGLREYFQLCRSARRRLVAMPSQAVDDAWHEFILFTRTYQAFCQRALGRFLHHTPAEAMRAPTDAQDSLKRAWRLACRREGIDPKGPQTLPRLFALDALLGIAGGFVYHLDCLAAAQAGTSATGFCASHIGCGGGCAGGDGGGSNGSSDGGDAGSGDGGGCGGGCGGD